MKPGNKVFIQKTQKQIGVIKTVYEGTVVFETFDGETRVLNPDYHYVTNGDDVGYKPWWKKIFNKISKGN